MTFEELYLKCCGEWTSKAFAEATGLSTREFDYVRAGDRPPSLMVWNGMLKAKPELREEINQWFLENVLFY